MGIDAQGNIGLCVPHALGNCDDIHAGINELAGVRVAQMVERQIRMARHMKLSDGVGSIGGWAELTTARLHFTFKATRAKLGIVSVPLVPIDRTMMQFDEPSQADIEWAAWRWSAGRDDA